MAPQIRRRGQQPPPPESPPEAEPLTESEDDFEEQGEEEEESEEEELEEGRELTEEEEAELLASPPLSPQALPSSLPPPNFREISTLASWTVSSSKPGCSIPQLRHPSTALFWQSDGPQPHYLNIHFFKLVRIVGLRLYLDFEADESYTPTRIILLAGSGMNDLVEWGEMKLESPRGWVWADFEGVGDVESGSSDSESPNEDEEDPRQEPARGHGIQGTGGQTLPRPPNNPGIPPIDDSDFENTAPRNPHLHDTFNNTNLSSDDPMPIDPTTPHFPPNTPHNQFANTAAAAAAATPHFATTTPMPNLPRPHPRHALSSLSPTDTPGQAPRRTPRTKKPKLPTLRCHLVQIKILENHQNGKDTHLRGLQIFSLDGAKEGGERGVVRQKEKMKTNATAEVEGRRRALRGLVKSGWMAEPSLR